MLLFHKRKDFQALQIFRQTFLNLIVQWIEIIKNSFHVFQAPVACIIVHHLFDNFYVFAFLKTKKILSIDLKIQLALIYVRKLSTKNLYTSISKYKIARYIK